MDGPQVANPADSSAATPPSPTKPAGPDASDAPHKGQQPAADKDKTGPDGSSSTTNIKAAGDLNIINAVVQVERKKRNKVGKDRSLDGAVFFRFEDSTQPSADRSDRPRKAPYQFEDPTQPLPSRPAELLDLPIDDRDHILHELKKKRALLLTSYEPEPALAAAYSIVCDGHLAAYERRALVLDKKLLRDRDDLDIDLLSRPEYLDKKKQILLVEINHEGAFLNSLLSLSHTNAGWKKDLLRERDSFLVCTTSSQILKLVPEQRMPWTFPFVHRPVPWLPYTLRQHFPPERAQELEALLLDQLKRGFWQSIEDLYADVLFYLKRDGSEGLEGEIRRKEAIPRGLSIRESLDQAQTVKAGDLFRDDAGVHAAVLYTATYFPDLTPQDCQRIILLLLADRTMSYEMEEQIVNDKGEIQTLKKTAEKLLAAVWHESPDRILRECELRASTLRDGKQGTHTVDFNFPYLRREMHILLESRYPMFLVRMFDRLQSTGFLFALEASAGLVDNLIQLFVERALSDPGFCNKDWLFRTVVGLRFQFNVPLAAADPTAQFFELLAELHSGLKQSFLVRFSQLLREMIKHDETRQTVRDFFSALLGAHEQAALEILLDLFQRLRFTADFDALYWMRRLIDEGGKGVREETYQCIFGLSLGSGPRILEILETLNGWLPEETRSREQYSPSNLYALRFLLEYSSHTVLSFPERFWGDWPSRYALFAAFPDDPDALRTRSDLLCGWLLHRAMPSILAAKDEGEQEEVKAAEDDDAEEDLLELDIAFTDYDEVHAILVADLAEQWLLILEGTGAGGPEARRVGDALIGALAKLAPHATRAKLIRRWQWRAQEYANASGRLAVTDRDKRRRWLDMRKKVFDLKQRFVAAGNDRAVN